MTTEHSAPSEWRERVAAVVEDGIDERWTVDEWCASLLPLLAEAQAEALRTEADKVEGAWQRHRDNGKRCCAASLYPLPDLIRASADRIGGGR